MTLLSTLSSISISDNVNKLDLGHKHVIKQKKNALVHNINLVFDRQYSRQEIRVWLLVIKHTGVQKSDSEVGNGLLGAFYTTSVHYKAITSTLSTDITRTKLIRYAFEIVE